MKTLVQNDAPAWAANLVAELGATRAAVERLNREVRKIQVDLANHIEAAALTAPDPAYRDKLYDTPALAERWGVSERTVDTILSQGLIVPTYIQSSRRFTAAAVAEYERSKSGLGRRRKVARRRNQAKRSLAETDRPPVKGKANGAAGGENDV